VGHALDVHPNPNESTCKVVAPQRTGSTSKKSRSASRNRIIQAASLTGSPTPASDARACNAKRSRARCRSARRNHRRAGSPSRRDRRLVATARQAPLMPSFSRPPPGPRRSAALLAPTPCSRGSRETGACGDHDRPRCAVARDRPSHARQRGEPPGRGSRDGRPPRTPPTATAACSTMRPAR